MDSKADTLAFAREFAAAGTDLYELLDVDAATGRDDIHRAWRRKGLRYHPDKAGDKYDPALYERFVRARDVLVDEEARAAYDTARAAAAQRRLQADQMSAERRRFKDELEAAERAAAAAAPSSGGGGGTPFGGSEKTSATASSEYEVLREAGRRRAAARLQRAQEAAERARQAADARADAREAALEQRLRDKEDKARRRAAKKDPGRPTDKAGDAVSRTKDRKGTDAASAASAADSAAWRALLRPQGAATDDDAAPVQGRPLYAHTLARLRAAGAADRQRRQAAAAAAAAGGNEHAAAPPPPEFQPGWDAVDDPAVRPFIARVPRWKANAAPSVLPMDTAG